jgi:glutathione S-transferase
MLKIWGRLSSVNVRKVVVTAQELGVPFERVDAGASFGIVRTPDFLAKSDRRYATLIARPSIRDVLDVPLR